MIILNTADIGLFNRSPYRWILGQFQSAVMYKSSLHLAWWRPTLRIPSRGL
jgi:hypothetical protein